MKKRPARNVTQDRPRPVRPLEPRELDRATGGQHVDNPGQTPM